MSQKRKLQVEAISDGTVIDHIPAGQGLKVLHQLPVLDRGCRITVGFNLPSQELGLKDLIKVENHIISDQEAGRLCLLAPMATVNIIENYVVRQKCSIHLPEKLENLFRCPNSNCITHNEPVNTVFTCTERGDEIHITCKYCEKVFSKDIMTEL